jgi:hypothetical protein
MFHDLKLATYSDLTMDNDYRRYKILRLEPDYRFYSIRTLDDELPPLELQSLFTSRVASRAAIDAYISKQPKEEEAAAEVEETNEDNDNQG